MPERFISEAIKPVTETADTSRMAIGEPGLPLSSCGGVEPSLLRRCYALGGKPGSVATAVRRCTFTSTGTRWPRSQTAP